MLPANHHSFIALRQIPPPRSDRWMILFCSQLPPRCFSMFNFVQPIVHTKLSEYALVVCVSE